MKLEQLAFILLFLCLIHFGHYGVVGSTLGSNEQCAEEGEASCHAPNDDDNAEEDNPSSSLVKSIESCTTLDCIVSTLKTSSTFKTDYWQRKPLLFHFDPSILSDYDALVSFDDLLDVASSGLRWSDNNAAMVSTVRVGDTKDFRFDYSHTGQYIQRDEMIDLAKRSTILIGTVHSIHAGVSKVVLAFQRGFGLIASSNIYSTQPDFATASPLHTDRMDAFVIQTSGSKHWKVYEPGVHNPVFGVHGDAQWAKGGGKGLPVDVIGELLIDTELRPGSILYLPRGFPHGTSTVEIDTDDDDDDEDDNKQQHQEENRGNAQTKKDASVALTVSLHTESMHIVYEKLLRCALSIAGYCASPPPIACGVGSTLTRHVRSDDGAKMREGLPLGFLSKSREDFVQQVVDAALPHGLKVVELAERDGVEIGSNGSLDKIEESIRQSAEMVYDRSPNDLRAVEHTFAVDGNNKDIPYEERQKHFDDTFNRAGPFVDNFCHHAGPRALFSDYRATETDEFNSRLASL